jgi:hypothetical protein
LVFLGRNAALGRFWSGTKDTTDFGVLSGVALGSSVLLAVFDEELVVSGTGVADLSCADLSGVAVSVFGGVITSFSTVGFFP